MRRPRNAGGKLSVAILPLSDWQYCRTTFSRSAVSPGWRFEKRSLTLVGASNATAQGCRHEPRQFTRRTCMPQEATDLPSVVANVLPGIPLEAVSRGQVLQINSVCIALYP